MFNFTVSVYPFAELSEKAKQNAIQQHREFLLSSMRKEDFISGCAEYDTPEELQKAYDSTYDYYLMNDEPIIDSITINEYMFFEDGELAHTCHYCAGDKSGETWIDFHGKQICIAKNQMTKCYELIPNTRQKSFYGKAKVIEQNGKKLLQSYNTIVCSIDNDGRFSRHWAGESATTMKHVNSFLYLFGIDGGGVNWWREQTIVPFF